MVLSKNKIKFFNSLIHKKNRDELHLFVAEGTKLVMDLLPYYNLKYIVASVDWLSEHNVSSNVECFSLSDISEMKKISFLVSPSPVFAVFEYKNSLDLSSVISNDELFLALDTVQDPGNLGTIIRLADWFGIKHIFCSHESADFYNPKVVQATMGALSRVDVHYCNLSDVLTDFTNLGVPIFGTFLDGDLIYDAKLPKNGIIIMGNEGKGISDSVSKFVSKRLFIPNYPLGSITSESLNVAIATAIICSEFRRR